MIGCEAYAGKVIAVLGVGRNGLAGPRPSKAGGAAVWG